MSGNQLRNGPARIGLASLAVDLREICELAAPIARTTNSEQAMEFMGAVRERVRAAEEQNDGPPCGHSSVEALKIDPCNEAPLFVAVVQGGGAL
jgi:hypothetical protein